MTTITDTGPRGFLKWFKQEQPAIYAQIAPELQRRYPQLFSAYMTGGWKLHALADTGATVDTSDAANTGSTTSDIINGISQLIGAGTAAYLDYQQAQTQQQIVNAQLQNAMLGRPPLQIGLQQNGVPQISFAATTSGQVNWGTLLLYGVGGWALLKLAKVV